MVATHTLLDINKEEGKKQKKGEEIKFNSRQNVQQLLKEPEEYLGHFVLYVYKGLSQHWQL